MFRIRSRVRCKEDLFSAKSKKFFRHNNTVRRAPAKYAPNQVGAYFYALRLKPNYKRIYIRLALNWLNKAILESLYFAKKHLFTVSTLSA